MLLVLRSQYRETQNNLGNYTILSNSIRQLTYYFLTGKKITLQFPEQYCLKFKLFG